MQPHGFFLGRDYDRRFDPRSPAVDNLAAALALERGNGSGWVLLASLAAEESAAPLPSRPGVFCAPAGAQYDVAAFARLLTTTYTQDRDWAYPRADETPIHTAPMAGAAVAGTLGLHFVQLLGFDGAEGEPAPGRMRWAHVAAPDGRIGFVEPAKLRMLAAERLCYAKDSVGNWRIAGYISGGN
jgi:hypothetical protein